MAQSLSFKVVSSTENSPRAYDEASLEGCPRFKILSGFLPPNSEIALGYVRFGHRPIPHVLDRLGSYYSPSTNPVRTATDEDLPGVEK
jgi:hypothetical protein